jgi:hypothetical protein
MAWEVSRRPARRSPPFDFGRVRVRFVVDGVTLEQYFRRVRKVEKSDC